VRPGVQLFISGLNLGEHNIFIRVLCLGPTDHGNRALLKDLLGQIIIRNTRALAGIHIPPMFPCCTTPVTKQMDPLVCQSCGVNIYSLGLCKNMHLNCITCLNQGCTLCQ